MGRPLRAFAGAEFEDPVHPADLGQHTLERFGIAGPSGLGGAEPLPDHEQALQFPKRPGEPAVGPESCHQWWNQQSRSVLPEPLE